MELIAIDPPGCGCTECITGEYVPLNEATEEQITQMLVGKVRNNTAQQLRLNLVYIVEDEQDVSRARNVGFEVIAEHGSWDGSPRTWNITDPVSLAVLQYRFGHEFRL